MGRKEQGVNQKHIQGDEDGSTATRAQTGDTKDAMRTWRGVNVEQKRRCGGAT